MTYAIVDSRHAPSKDVAERSYQRFPDNSFNAFVVYLHNLGHADYIGLVDTQLGRAFHFDPRQAKRGVKELKWDGRVWRKP